MLFRSRIVRPIADLFVAGFPLVNALFARLGVVSGTRANVRHLLADGELLAIFPEGVSGVAKPFRERYHLAVAPPLRSRPSPPARTSSAVAERVTTRAGLRARFVGHPIFVAREARRTIRARSHLVRAMARLAAIVSAGAVQPGPLVGGMTRDARRRLRRTVGPVRAMAGDRKSVV